MRQAFPLLLAAGLLCGCQTASDQLDEWFPRPAMVAPQGINTKMPAQDTPELEARAARERESLPSVPPAPDPETYFNLGTVPPKPVLPTPEQIAAQVGGLQAEQKVGAAAIAVQADAEEPDTLPKQDAAAGKSAKTRAQGEVSTTPMEGPQSLVFSRDNQAFLPQSQTIEQSDLHPTGPQP